MNINQITLKRNGSLSYGNNPNKIILHHAEMDGDIQAVNQVHLDNGWTMIGYNYYIRKDGSVWEGRPTEAIGAHCYGQNATSIGICFEGNFMKDVMNDAQFNLGVELCKYLLQKHSGIKEIGGHKKYYNTDCPGTNFPLDKMINAALAGGSVSVTAAVNISNNILRLWSTGDAVRDLQVKLNKSGYGLAVDGIYGQNTFNAVEHF